MIILGDQSIVAKTTILNYFKSCGFIKPHEVTSENNFNLGVNLETDWNRLQSVYVQFEDFVTCDDEVAVTGTLTDVLILDRVN